MDGNETIGLDIAVRLDQIRAEMSKLGPMAGAEGKAMASELNKALKQVAVEAKKTREGITGVGTSAAGATKEMARTKAGLTNLGNQLSDVASQLSTGTNPFTILVQQGPQVAGALDLMGVSLTKMAALGAAAALIAGTLYGAYSILTRETEREASAREFAHTVAVSYLDVERKITAEKIALKVATGEYTKAEGEEATAREVARQGVLDYARAQLAVKTQLLESLEAGQKFINLQRGISAVAGAWLATLQKIAHPSGDWTEYFRKAARDTDAVIDVFTGLESGADDLRGRLNALGQAEVEEAEKLKKLRDITIATSKAKGEAGKATDEQAEAERRLEAAILAQFAASNRAKDILTQSGDFRLTAEERLQAELAKTSQAYFDAGIEAKFSMERIAAGEIQLAEDTAEQIRAIRDAAAKEAADKAAAEQAAAEALAMRKVRMTLTGIADLTSGVASAMGDAYQNASNNVQTLTAQLAAGESYYTAAQKRQLEERIGASERAARRAFEVEKAAKLAAAVVNTASAVVSALANPPGPPFSIPQAIAAGAQGAVQIAAIAGTQPAFHTGYAPDEMSAKILTREAVVTPQGVTAMGGSQAVRDVNAGVSNGSAAPPVVVTVYKNDAQRQRFDRDAIRVGNPFTELLAARASVPAWRRA